MKKLRTFFSVSVLAAAFVFGLNTFRNSIDQGLINRDPAAIQNRMLNPATLSSKEDIQAQLLKRFKIQPILRQDNSISKSLVFSGVSAQFCKGYATVELSFVADGASVSGETTSLKVVAPCEPGQNPIEMASIALPVQEILAEKPRSSEFTFSGYSGRFSFSHVAEEWPRTWVLRSIRFLAAPAATAANSSGSVVDALNVYEQDPSISNATPIVLEF